MFIDVHCHLELLPPQELENVIARAKTAGVGLIIPAGTDPKSNSFVLELSKNFPIIKPALGIYPADALKLTPQQIDETFELIRSNSEKIVAISEIGLDLKELDSLDQQEPLFRKFIELSKEIDKPMIIHSRKAEKIAIEILEEFKAEKVVMHCFSGKFTLIDRIQKNGWFLTVPTSIKNSTHFQELVRRVPLSQLLCETDSPFLHPEKKFPNEPANILASYKEISRIKNLSLSEVEKQIESNAKKIFKL